MKAFPPIASTYRCNSMHAYYWRIIYLCPFSTATSRQLSLVEKSAAVTSAPFSISKMAASSCPLRQARKKGVFCRPFWRHLHDNQAFSLNGRCFAYSDTFFIVYPIKLLAKYRIAAATYCRYLHSRKTCPLPQEVHQPQGAVKWSCHSPCWLPDEGESTNGHSWLQGRNEIHFACLQLLQILLHGCRVVT